MPQYKSKDNQTNYPRRCGKKLATGKVVNATLDSSRGINRCFVIVSLNDGAKFDFPVPTTQEIRDRFFYKKAKTQDKPARPPNKFFIFRTMFQGAIDDFKLQVPIVSGLASEVWKKCSPEVVELFTKLSQIAKSEHSEINPGYVYKPNRSKSRITKNKPNSLQEKSYQDLNDSASPTLTDLPPASLWTTASNCFDPSQANFNPDENSFTIEDSITTTAHDIQAISSHYAYYSSIDPSIHDITSPIDTINDINDPYQHQFLYPTPMNNLYYPSNDLSIDQFGISPQDMNALMQPNLPNLTTIPNHPIHYPPPTFNHMNNDYNDFFNSPISESDDMTLSSSESQLYESGCIDYSPDEYTFFQNLMA